MFACIRRQVAVTIDQSELRYYLMMPVYFHIHSTTIFGMACHRVEEAFCHSSENAQFTGKEPSLSWISTQSDMFSSFSRKQCDCWMTLNGFIHSFTSQVACLFLFDSGTLRKTRVKSAPCNVKTASRAIVADCRMCACSVCFNERKRPSELKLHSRMAL